MQAGTLQRTAQATPYDAGESITVDADTTLYAQWEADTYTITWVNDDDTVLETDKAAYGETPEYNGETPTKAADAQYTYTFAGWTPEITAVTGDATYKAAYTSTAKTYVITWKNYDGTTLAETEVAYGETPSYTGETPIRAADGNNSYEFSGWSPEITTVKGEATYTAQYIEKCTVTWMNGETVIYSAVVDKGSVPAYDEAAYGTPTKEADVQCTYTFSGWSPAVEAVSVNTTYYAQFTGTRKYVYVTFDSNGGQGGIEAQQVPTAETTALTANNEQITREGFDFTGWNTAPDGTGTAYADAAGVYLEESITLYAQWAIKTFTITWENDDGAILETDENVAYGTMPSYDGAVPYKEANAQYTYTFEGWTPEVGTVTADVTYKAVYNSTVNSYTITWVNEDGTVLQTGTAEYGSVPVYMGETPTKASTEEVAYTFAGWTPEVFAVTGDAQYTAVFTSEDNLYTVSWVNYDGTPLKTAEGVTYSTIPTYDGETPVKPGDAQYSYSFTGWSSAQVSVENLTIVFTAQFSQSTNSYTVIWQYPDGTPIKTDSVEYGKMPAYAGTEPSMPGDAQYSYKFAGWSPEIAVVTDNAVYTAVFSQTVNTYTVKWQNYDGSELHTEYDVPYGTTPSYDVNVYGTPAKPETESSTYSFSGWTPQIEAVTKDVVYTAQFAEVAKTFTITWVNEDGSVLETDAEVPYGATPVYDGAEPTKQGDAQYSYSFTGWTPAVTSVTADAVYTAAFAQTVNKYRITWLNFDGSSLDETETAYGEIPVYAGAEPTKEGDAQYSYTFTGWDPEIMAVTGEASYTAQFDESVNTYTVTWKNEDGTVLELDENVEYGTVPAYDGETPTKEEDEQYTYEFKGWDPELTETTTVEGDMTFTAVYAETEKTFTVTWVDDDGTVLETDENVAYGSKPEYNGAEPTKERDSQGYSYTFDGWNPKITETTTVTEDTTYTAVYTKSDKRTFNITWVDENGTVLETDEVEAGRTPSYLGAIPTKADDDSYRYSFAGWTPQLTAAEADATYTATYTATARVWHTVYFDANGGSGEMAAQAFEEGVSTELNVNAFSRDNYRFTGWNSAADGSGATYADGGSIIHLDSDMTLYAQWQFQNGWFTDDIGKTYYIDGEKAYFSSWQEIDGAVYYFDENGYVVTGINSLTKDGVEGRYVFGSDGVFQSGLSGVYSVGSDTYWVNGGMIEEYAGLKQVVNETGHIHYYYFGEDSLAVKNGSYQVVKNNGLRLPCYSYQFDADGVIVHDEDTSKNGICDGDGSRFYYIDGVKVGEGLLYIDGSYYYARTSSGEIVRGRSYWISKTNRLPIAAGLYYFDEDGRLVLTGFKDADGYTYYYNADGTLAKGFTKIDDDYYYFNAGSGKLYKGVTLWVGENSCGVTGGWYAFGDDGKLIKTGFVTAGGSTWYYDNMVLAKGFTKIGDDYYFFNAGSGKLYRDTTLWVGSNSYGITCGMYYFGTDGKMVIPDLENGKKAIVSDENGNLYFTIDGARMTDGLYELDGYYYYAGSDGRLAVSSSVYLSTTLFAGTGWYGFDENGRLITDGFITGGDGYTYYYAGGNRAKGFTKIGEDYYLFNAGSGKMYKDATMWVGANDYNITGGMYYFGADGRMSTAD